MEIIENTKSQEMTADKTDSFKGPRGPKMEMQTLLTGRLENSSSNNDILNIQDSNF